MTNDSYTKRAIELANVIKHNKHLLEDEYIEELTVAIECRLIQAYEEGHQDAQKPPRAKNFLFESSDYTTISAHALQICRRAKG